MKVISIRQPWAWLIVNGHKDIENRDWKTKFRGPVLVHASKKFDKEGYDFLMNSALFDKVEMPDPEEFERGGIVGQTEIVDCVEQSRSHWFFGDYGFVLENSRPLPFQQCRGALGFFNPQINTP